MTVNSSDAPWNEPDRTAYFECSACYKVVEGGEAEDPCYIDGRPFCDDCASNLTHLKLDGYIKDLKPKTEALKLDEKRISTG